MVPKIGGYNGHEPEEGGGGERGLTEPLVIEYYHWGVRLRLRRGEGSNGLPHKLRLTTRKEKMWGPGK